jgi:hypothetical protein
MTQNEDLTEQITKVLKRLDILGQQYRIMRNDLCLEFELGMVRTDLERLRDSLHPKEVVNDK